MFDTESGSVASVWFTFVVVAIVSIILWAVFDPLLRGPLLQLVQQTVGNPVKLGASTFDATVVANYVKGFFFATFWASLVILIVAPLRKTGEKYRVD